MKNMLQMLAQKGYWLSGGADRVRTDDLLRATQALFQLSYGPTQKKNKSYTLRALRPEQKVKCAETSGVWSRWQRFRHRWAGNIQGRLIAFPRLST